MVHSKTDETIKCLLRRNIVSNIEEAKALAREQLTADIRERCKLALEDCASEVTDEEPPVCLCTLLMNKFISSDSLRNWHTAVR